MNNNNPHLESLLEYLKFFELLDHRQLQSFLPEQFQAHAQTMSQVKGSPFYGLIGAMVDCGAGLFLFALGGILSKSFTNLLPLERYVLAASPMITGGCLRIWATNQSDKGQGKQAILKLLSASLLGVIGHIIMLSLSIDLSSIHTRDANYYIFLMNNILTGVGIATYSAGMALGAQAAPHDNPESFFKHLEDSSKKLGQPLHANCLETSFASILRNHPRQYLALIACVSNFAPGMTLVSSSFLIPMIGLRNTYIFFAGMTSLGMLTTWFCVENSIVDQLKKIKPEMDASLAKEIAIFMGQRIFPSDVPFIERLTQLDKIQKAEIIKATMDYTLTFGLSTALTAMGPMILQNKGASLSQAVLTMAGVSMLSSLMRGLMTVVPDIIKTDTWMLLSIGMMLSCSIVLQYADNLSLVQADMLIFGVFNGIGNFCVVDRVSQKIPQDIGLATGISSGIAAFLAFPMSIMLAQENQCFMAICALGLIYHIYQHMIEYCDSKSHASVHVLEMTSP